MVRRIWLQVAACCLFIAVQAASAFGATVFLGGSQTAGWNYVGGFPGVVNKGVVSNNTSKILKTLQPVIDLRPDKVFILEGINEMRSPNATILGRYRKIVERLRSGAPGVVVVVQSVLPVTGRKDLSNEKIVAFNTDLRAMCAEIPDCVYVDLHSHFVADGQLDRTLTNDGVHLTPAGYVKWRALIEDYVNASREGLLRGEEIARLNAPGSYQP